MKFKIKITEVPQDSKLKAGSWVTATAKEMEDLAEAGHKFINEAEDALIKSREATIDAAIKACKHFAPQEDTAVVRADALAMELTKPGLGVTYITGLAPLEAPASGRVTAHQADTDTGTVLDYGNRFAAEPGIKETVKAFLHTEERDAKLRHAKGGMIRAVNSNHEDDKKTKLREAYVQASDRSHHLQRITDMINAGADFRLTENYIKAAYDGYADPAGALGVLNTALTLQWNFGHLENMLMVLDNFTTDMSGTPVYYNQEARSRYIKVPGVQLKTSTTSWTGAAGNDVDVNVLMGNYAGVPITINEMILGATGRQLFNEQKAPQLYGLAEYIFYTIINCMINGSTRFSNTGTATSTIYPTAGYSDNTFGAPGGIITPGSPSGTAANPAGAAGTNGSYFNVFNATLSTFVGSLVAAMDVSKFPGGQEPAGAADLLRWGLIHTALYSQIASDTNLQLNMTLQGIRQDGSHNLIQTGMFDRIGNVKYYKSQLMADTVATTGTGADGSTNAMFVTAPAMANGAVVNAHVVGAVGTRSALMFVSRPPLDYTKVMPEIPSTAAVELYTTPKLGMPFMIVKFLDHAYENANMRASTMWGPAIGDERQLLLLRQA